MSIHTHIEGLDQLTADLTSAPLKAQVKAANRVHSNAERTAEVARRNVPKRRPQLAGSITAEMVDPFTAEVGPENALGGGYGHIVEKGDSHRAPRPYLVPALDETEPGFIRDMDDLARGIL